MQIQLKILSEKVQIGTTLIILEFGKAGNTPSRCLYYTLNSMLAGWFSWSEYDPLMNMDWRNQLDPEIIPEWAAIRGLSIPGDFEPPFR